MSRSVMVVEDDRAIRETLCALLVDEGYRATGAANGREALDILRRDDRPCVILLDLMMPVMDGPTFRAEQLQDPNLRSIPLVIITAGGHFSATSLKADAVLLRPLRAADIFQVVDSLCRAGH